MYPTAKYLGYTLVLKPYTASPNSFRPEQELAFQPPISACPLAPPDPLPAYPWPDNEPSSNDGGASSMKVIADIDATVFIVLAMENQKGIAGSIYFSGV